MLEKILKKFENYEIEPIDVGIINHVIKLRRKTNDFKMILKIYRDVGHLTKDKRFHKEIAGYEEASKIGIPIPRIYEVNKNSFYILMENLEGITLKEAFKKEDLNLSTKYQLIDQLIYFLVKLNSEEIQEEEDMNSYLHSFFLKIENCMPEIKNENLNDFVSNKFSLLYQKFLQLQPSFRKESFLFLHGDLNFSNIIISKNFKEIKGIVDWERSHYGHRLEDLAKITKINYLDLSDYILDRYCKRSPTDEEKLPFFKNLFSLSYIVFFNAYLDEYNFQKEGSKKYHERLSTKNIIELQNFQL